MKTKLEPREFSWEQPKEIMIATIEVLVMPNGNIVSYGKIIGKFKDFKKYLKNIRKAN